MSLQDVDVFSWLDTWEGLINRGDFEAARPLFSPEVLAFGTVTGSMKTLPVLEERQWRKVWGKIKDFRFDKETAVLFRDEGSRLATIACAWSSLGRTQSSWYQRRGRVTLVLRREGKGLQSYTAIFRWSQEFRPWATIYDASWRVFSISLRVITLSASNCP